MSELNKQEIRSPEMQDVMTGIPGSFLRWGLFLFFAIVASILGVSWFISSPGVVTAPVTLTTYNAPVPLIARSGGTIALLFAGNGDKIEEGMPAGLIGNQADWTDIKILSDFVEQIVAKDMAVKEITIPPDLNLGELQSPYIRLIGLIDQYHEYLSQAYIPGKLDLLGMQITRQEEYIAEMKNQLRLSEEDLQLSVNSYRRDSILFASSNYSITVSEIERSRQYLLQKMVAFSALRSNIKNTESSMLRLRESELDLKVQYEKEISQYNKDVNEALQVMRASLGDWKEKYLICSPVSGTITFTGIWNINQTVKAGELFATVIPDVPGRIIVRATVPASGVGRIRAGQEVNIKLEGYPYMEYGVIKGTIRSVSLVPGAEGYIAEVDPVTGLRTTYGFELGFINDMTGSAEIITDNTRLIFRLVKPLRSVFKNWL